MGKLQFEIKCTECNRVAFNRLVSNQYFCGFTCNPDLTPNPRRGKGIPRNIMLLGEKAADLEGAEAPVQCPRRTNRALDKEERGEWALSEIFGTTVAGE